MGTETREMIQLRLMVTPGILVATAIAVLGSVSIPACSSKPPVATPDVDTVDAVDAQDSWRGVPDVDAVRIPEDVREAEKLDLADGAVEIPQTCNFFGCPCDESGDCDSGFCVEHMGSKVCSSTCVEECPQGWSCEQVGTGADQAWVCISYFERLCQPCWESPDCVGDLATVCVRYDVDGIPGTDAAFCGADCGSDEDCPEGLICVEVETIEGNLLEQCVIDGGLCDCTQAGIKLGLSTVCEATNEWGTCQGKRVCSVSGLTACDALTPAEDTCDGLDNDCDGSVDENVEDCCSCGDGQCHSFCESVETCCEDCHLCGNGVCECGEGPCACESDCCGVCGDGKCASYQIGGEQCCNETQLSCPDDCGPTACGNASCEKGENPFTCPQDCEKFVCGNELCEPGEDIDTCPADCDKFCGNCECEGGEQESFDTCPNDCGFCGDGYCSACAAAEEDIESCSGDCCVPNCEAKECGDDGCLGVCGACQDGLPCTLDQCDDGVCSAVLEDGCLIDGTCYGTSTKAPDNSCLVCHPGKSQSEWSVLDDGVECGLAAICTAGECDCAYWKCEGTCCEFGQLCHQGVCCTPQCLGKECGEDMCGASCGACGLNETCSQDGKCMCIGGATSCSGACCQPGDVCNDEVVCCTTDCVGRECGSDGCDGECGVCGQFENSFCLPQGLCDCAADCQNKECGEDGCGGSCGECPEDHLCLASGKCYCVPQCEGKQCGPNGCGGQCGFCVGLQEECLQGDCICQPDCLLKNCGGDGCGGDCGQCPNLCTGEVDACLEGICQHGEPVECDFVSCPPKYCVPASGECQALPNPNRLDDDLHIHAPEDIAAAASYTEITGIVYLNDTSVTSLALPELTCIGEYLYIALNGDLTTFSFPDLVTIGGPKECEDNGPCGPGDCVDGFCQGEDNGYLYFNGNPSLLSFDLGSLEYAGEYVLDAGNTSLPTSCGDELKAQLESFGYTGGFTNSGGTDGDCGVPDLDADGDGVDVPFDNCPTVANFDQLDSDADLIGDACECLDVTCTPINQCHAAGICDATTGDCSNPLLDDDTGCDDSNDCTQSDGCVAGVCTGMDPVLVGGVPCGPVSCPPKYCVPATGECQALPNPNRLDDDLHIHAPEDIAAAASYTEITGIVYLNDTSVTSLALPELTCIGEYLYIALNGDLTTFSFPDLVTIGGPKECEDNGPCGPGDCVDGFCQGEDNGYLYFNGNPSLLSFDLGSLEYAGEYVLDAGNTSLPTSCGDELKAQLEGFGYTGSFTNSGGTEGDCP